jgi:hypothetical protein
MGRHLSANSMQQGTVNGLTAVTLCTMDNKVVVSDLVITREAAKEKDLAKEKESLKAKAKVVEEEIETIRRQRWSSRRKTSPKIMIVEDRL